MAYLDEIGLRRLAEKVMKKPVNHGTEGQILTQDENGDPYWSDAANDSNIAQAVEDWLEEKIVVSDTTIALDKTLKIEGAAADAKAAGALVKVSNTQPEEASNRVWINSGNIEEIEVPTIAEHNAKADRADTVLDTTLSHGRKDGTTVGTHSVAYGGNVEASGNRSVAFGYNVVASGTESAVFNNNTKATGNYSAAFNLYATASGKASAAFNERTTASGVNSTAHGRYTVASGNASFAEGSETKATGENSHAEGDWSTASGSGSHAEGVCTFKRTGSLIEIIGTVASGDGAHAEGQATVAAGDFAHSEGQSTIANHRSQHAAGEYNVPDSSTAYSGNRGTYVEIIGNGSDDDNRSNARTLDWNGNEVLAGDLTVKSGTTDETSISQIISDINTLKSNFQQTLTLIAEVKEAIDNGHDDTAISLLDTFLIDNGYLA